MRFRAPAAYETPFEAVAVEGEVVVMGQRVSEAITPEAARLSAERIQLAADQAMQQRADMQKGRATGNVVTLFWEPGESG